MIGPCWCSWYSNVVTMPKLPPPPRSAQNRSAFSSSLACTSVPSAVTMSAEIRLSQVRPCVRARWPSPPPSVKPAIPVLDTRPPVTARPNACVSWSKPFQVRPPWALAVLRTGSTTTPCIGERSMTIPSSTVENPAIEWAPPRTAMVKPWLRANRTAAITSAVPAQRTIRAGRRSCMPFQTDRAAS